MSGRKSAEKPKSDKPEALHKATRFTFFPWKLVSMAAVPLGLLVFYVTIVAPGQIPVPADVKVPFPALTRLLEEACTWCGENRGTVTLAGLGLLAVGLLFRITMARYYRILAILACLTLVVTYLSISAPIDRLLKRVEASLPKDNRVPTHGAPEDPSGADEKR